MQSFLLRTGLASLALSFGLSCATAPRPTRNPELKELLGNYRTWGAAQTELGAYGRKLSALVRKFAYVFVSHITRPERVGSVGPVVRGAS